MAPSSGRSAGVFVAGLTALAFGVVSFLAYQAAAAEDDGQDSAPGPRAGATATPTAGASPPADEETGQTPLPAGSGAGERVVYSLGQDRVWLVGADDQVTRTYPVWPGTVDPRLGTYEVTSRTAHITGTDGVPVENVVVFGYTGDTVIGFSAALDGSEPDLDPSEDAGGIRERTADGKAMWRFATAGTKVTVVR